MGRGEAVPARGDAGLSLGVVIKGSEGVVLAADSRITLEAQQVGGPRLPVNFDNATKLMSFAEPHTNVGAATYGAAVIGKRTAHSFIPEFEVSLANKQEKQPLDVEEFAKELSGFYAARWNVERFLRCSTERGNGSRLSRT